MFSEELDMLQDQEFNESWSINSGNPNDLPQPKLWQEDVLSTGFDEGAAFRRVSWPPLQTNLFQNM